MTEPEYLLCGENDFQFNYEFNRELILAIS